MSEALHEQVVAAIGDQYQLEREIGRGGMSVVYCARDRRLNRQVAIKVLPPELAYDPAIRTRFTREAQTSAQLSHAHIVPIYDVGERAGIAYFVMSYIGGGNLAGLLAREPRLPIEETRRLLCEVADALAYAHLHGVVHRDIKPDNILLDANSGRAMVTDFGIARAMEGGSRLTVTGIAVGTPTYMSPEQAEGDREIDGRSDIYSLGVLGYQMLTGRVPFTGGNTMALLLKHITERPRPVVELRPDAPKALREAVERSLMKAPEDRWPTAAVLRDAIMAGDVPIPVWRAERREPVRYTSPVPESRQRDRSARESSRGDARSAPPRAESTGARGRSVVPTRGARGEVILEPDHLASFTPEQRFDIRLWHGRIRLLDRVKAMRGYAWLTTAAVGGGIMGVVLAGSEPEIAFPLFMAPLVPAYMAVKLWRRGKSLRASGLKLRRVLLMPRAKWVIPKPRPDPAEQRLQKLATREMLESPYGAAIVQIAASLAKEDREMLPDLPQTANALLERVTQLADMLHRLEHDFDSRLVPGLDARIAEVEGEGETPERERRLSLLRRQRDTLHELGQRRSTLAHQFDNATLTLGNLRLDLIKLRSSGLHSALSDVTSATQEARALSREIGRVLEAAAEVRSL